jgi:hypothetical protein
MAMPSSLVARRLGAAAFGRLHPASRERHGFGPEDGLYSIGVGTMDRVWHSTVLFAPFLLLGSARNIMFPESGKDVPFRIECWSYRDRHGRDTLSLNRSFEFPGRRGSTRTRRFDEYLVELPADRGLRIYVGSQQHLAATITVAATERGGVRFATGAQRLFTRAISLRFPMLLSATAEVEEWFDDSIGRFRIEARVRNRIFGDVLGCRGTFTSSLAPIPSDGVPSSIRPRIEEARG